MPRPGPSVTSGADLQPGSDSLFPSGFTGGGAKPSAGSVGTSEIADGSVAAADLNLASVATALAGRSEFTGTYARKAAVSIDLNAQYGVKPGDDVTTALQTAINWIATNSSNGGEVVFTEVGTYLLNGAQQTGTALGVNYSGQVLFPAKAFLNGTAMSIRIRGSIRPNTGILTTGQPTGVVLQSNATTGYVFDCIPAEAQWGFQWTGIMPIFEDVTIRCPDNPQCGALNLEWTLRAKLSGVNIDTTGAWTTPTGTREALVLPHYFNNGDVTVRDANIRGYPVGVKISENCIFDNVFVLGCGTAFKSVGGGRTNWFGWTNASQCPVIFDVSGAAIVVNGMLTMENVYNAGQGLAHTTFVTGAGSTSQLSGDLDVALTYAGGMGVDGTLTQLLSLRNITNPQGSGWRNLHPSDNFARINGVTISGANAPGQCWPTLHPWRIASGGWTVASSRLTGTTSANAALIQTKGKGESRAVSATVTLGATSYSAGISIARPYNNSTGLWVKLSGGNLTLGVGSAFGGTTLKTASGVVTGGGTYTVTAELYYSAGKPTSVAVYLGGALQFRYALTASQITGLAASTVLPYSEDGVFTADTNSYFTAFSVAPAVAQPPYLSSGTATLVAGTVTVTDANVTTSSVIRYFRTTAGGTLGDLSLSLSAGASFTITSTSNTETSTIYYEVVSY